jgi:hypothetical protein
MGEDGAGGFADRHLRELHAYCSCRSARVISAMMEMAISAGPRAPMASPMGAWMRASASGSTPAAFSRSRRPAWVFFEPSAPT